MNIRITAQKKTYLLGAFLYATILALAVLPTTILAVTPAEQAAQDRINSTYPQKVNVPDVTTEDPTDTVELIKTTNSFGSGGEAMKIYYRKESTNWPLYDVQYNGKDGAYQIQKVHAFGGGVTQYGTIQGRTIQPASGYTPLVPIPGLTEGNSAQTNLVSTIQTIYRWGLIIAVLLSVLMTIIGGIQYMTSDALFNKKEGKQKIYSAILGLILALSSWIILYTINPRIVQKPESDLFGEKAATQSK